MFAKHLPVPVRMDIVGWRRVEEGYVLVNMEEGTYFVIQGSSALIWEMLAASATPQQIIERLVRTYDIDVNTLAADLDQFLLQLTQRGLIGSAPTSEPGTVQ